VPGRFRLLSVLFGVTVALSLVAGTASRAAGEATKTVKIGVLIATTGALQPYGGSQYRGIVQAVTRINHSGGVKVGNTRVKFAIDYQEDQASPDLAVTGARTLLNHGVHLWLGIAGTGEAQAIEPIVAANDVVLISGGVTYDGPLFHSGKAFRLVNPTWLQLQAMVPAMAKKLGPGGKVAILSDTRNPAYVLNLPDLVKTIERAKLQVVVNDRYDENTTNDFLSELARIKNSGAEGIFVQGVNRGPLLVASQAKKIGMANTPIVSSAGVSVDQAKALVNPDDLNGLITVFNADASSLVAAKVPRMAAFVKAYHARFGTFDDRFSAYGHDAVYALVGAMVKSRSTDASKIATALKTLKLKDPYANQILTPFQPFKGNLFNSALGGAEAKSAWWNWSGGTPHFVGLIHVTAVKTT
jgi:ABC-type branched-subunit amino acid transport system substrate-binding protein